MNSVEYKTLLFFLEKYKNMISIEYINDMKYLFLPDDYKSHFEINLKDIGFILIKIEKELSSHKDLKNTYMLDETIKLFEIIWKEDKVF